MCERPHPATSRVEPRWEYPPRPEQPDGPLAFARNWKERILSYNRNDDCVGEMNGAPPLPGSTAQHRRKGQSFTPHWLVRQPLQQRFGMP